MYARRGMASVNPHTRELVFKLVFYGPGLGGKTTTLQYIHAATKPENRGKLVSLATPTDRTLYFDYLPLRLARVRGMSVRLQLFTVPGQVYYAATRKLVLSGADAIVFVADSQAGRADMNQESLDDLHANLAEHSRTLDEVPHTFHWNKRDLSDLLEIEELESRFNKLGAPSIATVATRGEGVFEGLERITRLVLKRYESEVQMDPTSDAPRSPLPPATSGKPTEQAVAEVLRAMEAPTKISATLPSEEAMGLGRRDPDSSLPYDPTLMSPSPVAARAAEPAAKGDALLETPKEGVDAVAEPPKDVAPRPGASAPARDAASPGASAPARDAASAPPQAVTSALPGSMSAPFSMAELWPESDRERIKQAESMIAMRDAVNAVLACDVLVTRVLASAAAAVGTLDAPRDPALVATLIGLDGRRYLAFRASVRAARHREPVTVRDALEAYAFAVEARRLRDLVRRERRDA